MIKVKHLIVEGNHPEEINNSVEHEIISKCPSGYHFRQIVLERSKSDEDNLWGNKIIVELVVMYEKD